MLPAYEDALARVYDPNQLERMEAAIRDVLDSGIADRVVRDEAWAHLASRLAAHEARGADVRVRLAAVVRADDSGAESTIESFAKVYHHRIGAPAGRATETGLPSWVTPPPAGVDGDNRDIRDWLHTQADLIQGRIDALVDATAANPEPWSKTLRPEPDDACRKRVWRRDLGNVVAYRDQHQITDTEFPLGSARDDDDAYTTAAASLERLRIVEDTAMEARRRIAALQQRLAGNAASADAVGVAERVRHLRDRELDPEQQHWDGEPAQRGPGHRPTI